MNLLAILILIEQCFCSTVYTKYNSSSAEVVAKDYADDNFSNFNKYLGPIYDMTSDITDPINSLNYIGNDDSGLTISQTAAKGKTIVVNSYSDLKDLPTSKSDRYFFKDTNSTLYYNETDGHWFEYFVPKEVEIKFFRLIPIGYCFECSTRGGASYSQDYAKSYKISDSLGLSLSRGAPWPIGGSISLAFNLNLAESFQYGESFSCDLSEGQMGQMFIQPKYVTLGATSARKVKFDKIKSLLIPIKGFKIGYKTVKLLMAQKPAHYCVTAKTRDALDCNSALFSQKVIELSFDD